MTPTHVTFPPVNPAGCLAREHFRRDVERGAARCKHVVVSCPLAAEAEVHDLDHRIRVHRERDSEHDVLQLEIPMHHVAAVHVVNSEQDLPHHLCDVLLRDGEHFSGVGAAPRALSVCVEGLEVVDKIEELAACALLLH